MRLRTVVVVASSIVASVMASLPAFAADLPPAPPVAQAPAVFVPPPPPFTWTGWYVGGNLGWGWTDVNLTDVGAPTFPPGQPLLSPGVQSSLNQNGFLGGAQLGVNYQINQFVIGLEGDFDYTDIKNSQSAGFLGGGSYKDPWTSTITARFGWAVDRALFYGKAGGAWMEEKYDLTAPTGSAATGTFNRWGWTVGAGFKYAIWDNVTAKVEYDFMDFGDQNQLLTGNSTDVASCAVGAPVGSVCISGDTSKSNLTASVVKAGINVLFH